MARAGRAAGAVRIAWAEHGLEAIEPTPREVEAAAAALAEAYNDPHNAPLLGHTEVLDAADVVDHYAEHAATGARQFLLHAGGVLVGDADLRGLRRGAAEFAFLIATRATQGRGLGTRFAQMIHTFGFATLGLDVIYASVAPANVASLRVFAKLGYHEDASPRARRYADEPGDVVLSIDRATFLAGHADATTAITIAAR